MNSSDKNMDTRECVLKHLETHDTVQPADIVDMVGKSRQAVSRELNQMGEQGILEAVPSEKGYVVWQLPGKKKWKGIRLSDLEHKGIMRMIVYLSDCTASPRDMQRAIRIDEDAVYLCIRILRELNVIETHSKPGHYNTYQLTEDGRRLAKAVRELERV